MSQEWMIDVLVDLRNFAGKNSLGRLVEQLDDTIHIAAEEISEHAQGSVVSERHGDQDRSVYRAHQL
jgi:hypothetical protein